MKDKKKILRKYIERVNGLIDIAQKEIDDGIYSPNQSWIMGMGIALMFAHSMYGDEEYFRTMKGYLEEGLLHVEKGEEKCQLTQKTKN